MFSISLPSGSKSSEDFREQIVAIFGVLVSNALPFKLRIERVAKTFTTLLKLKINPH